MNFNGLRIKACLRTLTRQRVLARTCMGVLFVLFTLPIPMHAADVYWPDYQTPLAQEVPVLQPGAYALKPATIMVNLPAEVINRQNTLTFVFQLESRMNCPDKTAFGCFIPSIRVNNSKYEIPVARSPKEQVQEVTIDRADLQAGENTIKATFAWKGNLSCAKSCGYIIQQIAIKGVAGFAAHPAPTPAPRMPQPTPIPLPRENMITITSTPPGATVLLNNQYQGVTPLLIRHLQGSQYLLQLEKEGYEPVAETIAVEADLSYTYRLQPVQLLPTPTPFATPTPLRVLASMPTPAPKVNVQEKRLALVIGNEKYPEAPLQNPLNDARAIAASLQRVGFDVMKYENVNQRDLKKAIDAFGERLQGYPVALFYYSGHGIQAKGANYLMPIDANLKSSNDIEYDCVNAERVLGKMEDAGSKTNIVILDACRNNPFEKSLSKGTRGLKIENGTGLAFMNAPSGSLIAYATSPGKVAFDAEEQKNSPYTAALLQYLETPNMTILEMFQQIRMKVMQDTNNEQTPWESTSLTGNFYFQRK